MYACFYVKLFDGEEEHFTNWVVAQTHDIFRYNFHAFRTFKNVASVRFRIHTETVSSHVIVFLRRIEYFKFNTQK